MKKLFVILPLVLALVLSSVAVFAEEPCKPCEAKNVKVNCDLPCDLGIYDVTSIGKALECGKCYFPVWFAVYNGYCANKGGTLSMPELDNCNWYADVTSGRNVKILNPYEPQVVVANRGVAASELAIAEQALVDAGLAETYRIPTLKISNIWKVNIDYDVLSYENGKDTKDGIKIEKKHSEGYVVLIEKKFMNVELVHHIRREGEAEVLINEVKENAWPVADQLTAERVPEDWKLSYVKDVNYLPAETKVTPNMKGNVLVDGEQYLVGYTVDMFYSNAKPAEGTDAATNGNKTAAASNLPATGAASNLYVVLASAVAVVLGVFLKK